jgi:hypothetical protein
MSASLSATRNSTAVTGSIGSYKIQRGLRTIILVSELQELSVSEITHYTTLPF